MYARSPDEPMPQPGSTPSQFSVQLYPYHQQAFHQHHPGPQSPYQDNVEPHWPQPAPPPQLNHPQPRPRPSYPSLSTSLPPIRDNRQSLLYASPQSLYHNQGNPPNVSMPSHSARYGQVKPPLPKPLGPAAPARRPASGMTSTHIHPQVPMSNSSGLQHQPYANQPVSGQYATPPRHHPPHHNHHSATLPLPQPSSVPPANHAPSYSPPLEPYAAAASIGQQPHPAPSMPAPFSPPPSFQEDEQFPVVEEKPPIPPDDEHEFAIALAMSQAEMLRKKSEEEKLSGQEEEDLARALAESLRMANQNTHIFGGEPSTASNLASQPTQNEDLSPLQLPVDLPPEAPSYVSVSSASKNATSFNEDVSSNMQNWQVPAAYNSVQDSWTTQRTSPPSMPSAPAASTYPTETLPQDRLDPLDNLPVYSDRLSSSLAAMESLQRTETDESRLVFDDEAYARQLLAEEEDELRRRIEEKGRMEAERQQQPEPDKLPQYTSEGLLSPDMGGSNSSSRRSSNAKEVPQVVQSQPARNLTSSATPSSSQVTSQIQSPPSFSATEQRPPLQTVNSNTSTSSTQSSQSGRPGITQQQGNRQSRPHASSMSSAGPSNPPQLTRHSSAGVVNPNHFLDRELLAGVTIGFKPPVLSLKLEPMQDPMPNIISLPSKRCPPLHLQAPNWRHMLRLLARLGNTRIEPTIEAMSDTKAELKLRIVIQFVLPHPQAVNVWRTVLWFTIDQPVPPNALGAARYTCGNPNVLPWSYTQSPLPSLLRGASDTTMSKTYTIPATDAIPLPTLPITFPNLALYLIAVLDESRRHSRSDALNGKLGKMVQMAYPSVKEDDYDDDGPGRSSVAGLFKRVIGRGNKDKNKGRSNNETYQMVIPFMSEWG